MDEDNNKKNGEIENLENCKVNVALRIRPFSQKELLDKSNKCINSQENRVFQIIFKFFIFYENNFLIIFIESLRLLLEKIDFLNLIKSLILLQFKMMFI